jgi:hypothetical protein
MGLLDKLKEGAEQAKDLAAAAAERAKDEAKELNLKRQLGNEREALGEKAYSLAEQGAISHADLEPHVARIRALTAEIEALRAEQPAEGEEQDAPEEPTAPAAPAGPATPTADTSPALPAAASSPEGVPESSPEPSRPTS